MQFDNATTLTLGRLEVELIDGSPVVSRGLLGWLCGRGPGVATIAQRWSEDGNVRLGGARAADDGSQPGELLFDYHRRRRLGLATARRLAWLGFFFGWVGLTLLHGPREGLEVLGGEALGAPVVVVQEGDSLGRIAARWNLTVAAIREANGLPDDVVWVGQSLELPLEPVPVPAWRLSLQAELQRLLTPEVQQQVHQSALAVGWLGLLAMLGVAVVLYWRSYERQTVWLYDLTPAEAQTVSAVLSELESACQSGLRSARGGAVRLEEGGLPGLHTSCSAVTLVVDKRRCVLLPDRVLLDEGDVARAINWDEFVFAFPPPDVMTGEGIGTHAQTLLLHTRLFDAVLEHPDPLALERLEHTMQMMRG